MRIMSDSEFLIESSAVTFTYEHHRFLPSIAGTLVVSIGNSLELNKEHFCYFLKFEI